MAYNTSNQQNPSESCSIAPGEGDYQADNNQSQFYRKKNKVTLLQIVTLRRQLCELLRLFLSELSVHTIKLIAQIIWQSTIRALQIRGMHLRQLLLCSVIRRAYSTGVIIVQHSNVSLVCVCH